MQPMNNIKAIRTPIHPIAIYVRILLGLFWNKVSNKNTCPSNGSMTNGCKTEKGSLNIFKNSSASTWNKNIALFCPHSKKPKSEDIIKRVL